jgi:hypothetical protein
MTAGGGVIAVHLQPAGLRYSVRYGVPVCSGDMVRPAPCDSASCCNHIWSRSGGAKNMLSILVILLFQNKENIPWRAQSVQGNRIFTRFAP